MREKFPDNPFVAPKMGNSLRLAIGDAPREDDSHKGEPFVDGAGRWFNMMIREARIPRESLTLCNVIQCHPPEDAFPTDPEAKYISTEDGYKAVSHCLKAHVEPLIKGRAWSRIDLWGEKPLRFIAGKTEGIYKWRGSPLPVPMLDSDKPIAIPTLAPSKIMSDQIYALVAINDLRKSLVQPPEYYSLYPSIEEVRNFKATEFCFDIETNMRTNEITMVGISAAPYFVMVVPFHGEYVSELKRIFRGATSVIGHNCIQFDLPYLRKNNVDVGDNCVVWDTMLLQHLLFPDFPHDLEFVGSQFCNKAAWKDDKSSFQRYCARDVDVTYQCFKQLLPMLRSNGLEKLYLNVQVPLARICRLMHDTGFKIDPNQVKHVREKLLADMAKAELLLPEPMRTLEVACNKRVEAPPGTLSPKTGKPVKFLMTPSTRTVVPWRSTPNKLRYLYSAEEPWCLNLPVQVDPKTERITTGKNALDKLFRKTKNPALIALRNLNKWDELITTFCKEEMVHAVNRMHPHFNVHGTASGRLSSSEPNLQNIPESARFLYVPSVPGWKIVEVDYSQIENRLTAYFANDIERLARFVRDPKFSEHKYAASLFLNIPYDEVEKSSDAESPYIKAKKIVHGTNYGEGAKRIAMQNDLDFKEVKELLTKWKNAIIPTIRWQSTTADLAKKNGYLATPFARKRWFYTSSYYTESLSFLPQSTAADVIFRSMIGMMYERIGWPVERVMDVVRVLEPIPQRTKLLLQVHDSLVFECPPDEVENLSRILKKVMEQPWAELGGLTLPCAIKAGDSWGECEEIYGPGFKFIN